MHRGTIGGGRPNIGQTTFWEAWDEKEAVEVLEDDSKSSKCAFVAELRTAAVPAQVAWFVHRVSVIKALAVGAEPSALPVPPPGTFPRWKKTFMLSGTGVR
jgi:hypothetical protein